MCMTKPCVNVQKQFFGNKKGLSLSFWSIYLTFPSYYNLVYYFHPKMLIFFYGYVALNKLKIN